MLVIEIGVLGSLIVKSSAPIFYECEVKNISESKFDKEYSTQWLEEKNWLSKHGIRYTFAKKIDGIDTYKYTKNLKLFKTLCSFYENVYSAK